ncbi:fumarylacetoacetate hydrolase family protein [Polaromonas sp. YR568]|uniref:fumarylacetoacetate hydrolase family protein n=1 Tax=Polaromonas sp. YR568 TaxID=1855301 RepID=UPI001113317E|nr:fumarylacetoacetate hydrolase family protein [Polaromonas sp. YR568]
MPTSQEQHIQAATELIARRKSGQQGPRLPEALRPLDLEAGWQVQQEVTRQLAQPVGGWKASVPRTGKLPAAPIYLPTLSREAVCAVAFPAGADTVKVEPELAFVLARDLPPRDQPYSEAEVDAAVGAVHAALEICASRYTDHSGLPFAELLADGIVNNGLWLGPELGAADVAAFALSWQVEGSDLQTADARHPDGHPRAPLYWLANFLRERGMGLKAGQAVITGSYAGLLTLPMGKRTRFDYAGLARFEVEFRSQ